MVRLVRDNGDGSGDGDEGRKEIPNAFKFDDSSGYSREKFYTRATDANGQGETVYIKINPSILGSVADFVASRQVPAYKNNGDLIRDALVHRLHELVAMTKDGTLENVVNRTIMLNRIQSRQVELSELGEILQRHEEAMEACWQAGDRPLLEELLSDADHDLEQLRPTYQKRLRELVEKYRGLWREMK